MVSNTKVVLSNTKVVVSNTKVVLSNTKVVGSIPIGPGLICNNVFRFQELVYEDHHYHEQCFRCMRCDRSLADEPFTCQDDALVCNDCYCNEFSSKCVACDKTIMPGRVSG